MPRRARSIAFCTATGTSRALPLPMPTRPSPSPTTVSAAKPRMRPPFTTLVTRLIPIIFSLRPSPRSSCCCCLLSCRCWAMSFALELEAAGARGFGERLHTAMEPGPGAIARHALDAQRPRLLGDALADHLRGSLVAAVLEVLAHVGFRRRRAGQHTIAVRRDDLRVDVAVAAVDHQARCALLGDAHPGFAGAAAASFLLRF